MPAIISNQPAEHESEQALRRAETVICLSRLPPFHAAALKLLNISSDSGTAIDDFERIFRGDPAIAADLLLVANSALFGNRAQVCTIRHALMHLGLDRVRSLSTTIALSFFVRNQPRTAFVRQIWAHSVATAVIVEVLGDLYKAKDLYTAGLVHDLGRLGLLLTVGPKYEEWASGELPNVEEANQLERARFGMNHCEAGSLVGHKWGYPVLLRCCMIGHHRLESGPPRDPLLLVQWACRIASAIGYPEVHSPQPEPFPELPDKARHCKELAPERICGRIDAQIAIIGG